MPDFVSVWQILYAVAMQDEEWKEIQQDKWNKADVNDKLYEIIYDMIWAFFFKWEIWHDIPQDLAM